MNDDHKLWAAIERCVGNTIALPSPEVSESAALMLQVVRPDGHLWMLPYHTLRSLKLETTNLQSKKPTLDKLIVDIAGECIAITGENLKALAELIADHRLRVLRLTGFDDPLGQSYVTEIQFIARQFGAGPA